MSKAAQEILDAALKLTEMEQEELLEGLMDSMGYDYEPPSDEEFKAELRRRIDDVESGRVKPIPWENARREIFRDDDEN